MDEMYLVSVNAGEARPLPNVKKVGRTGIYKLPVSGPVQISVNGLARDAICDTENHGGVDQAIYIYGTPDYDWWSQKLGRELAPGTFGENLTISGLESAQLAIGDRLRIGGVILEVTAPRVPCATLAARMGDPAFVKRFRAGERPGLYCRVLQAGAVQAGDRVTLEPYAGERLPAIEVFRDFYKPRLSIATLRRHLAAPIAIRDRQWKQEQLEELLAGAREAFGHNS